MVRYIKGIGNVFSKEVLPISTKDDSPNQSWTKDKMKAWLDDNNIDYPIKAIKKVLWGLINGNI